MRRINLISAFFAVLCLVESCSGGHQTPPPLDNKDTSSQVTQSSKEIMLWIDASANFRRFASKDSITFYLDKIKDCGFNKIVVDVKGVEGDCLYSSNILTQATSLENYTVHRDWDYLKFFIDEAHKRNIKVTASTTVFPMGSPSNKQGPVYRADSKWNGKTCIEYTPSGMLDIKNDNSKVAAFLNPALPEVREFALSFIKEIVTNYDIDGFALDYCRFPDYQSDFSDYSRKDFEKYIGTTVENWPADIFTYDGSGNRVAGKYYKQWWEYRSKIIRDFVAEARTTVKNIKSDVTLEYWAASWWGSLYANGQNWASPTIDPLKDTQYYSRYYSSWCSDQYYKTGFADQLDIFLLGAYLSTIYGPNNDESIEYSINRAKSYIGSACKMYGTIQCADASFDVGEAAYYCLKQTSGLMIFDIVHVINNGKWETIKNGIARALSENGK